MSGNFCNIQDDIHSVRIKNTGGENSELGKLVFKLKKKYENQIQKKKKKVKTFENTIKVGFVTCFFI